MGFRAIIAPFIFFACNCASTVAKVPHLGDASVAVFVNERGSIEINLTDLTITIASQVRPLEDCSTSIVYCFKNEELGFHIAVPRLCRTPHNVEGLMAGGHRFYEISMVEHGDPRQGRYVSTLGDAFAFSYFLDRGIFEIRYDPAGQWQFGPRSNGTSMPSSEVERYTYQMPANQAFLRCR
ncbi:MAG: hypothetical protein E6G92_10030 [Alphaproteobacteria bacterium]|nr:MAG: hypothetical protein E6G92_10030 [Alphaproteobacteria bacterium]